MNENDYLRWETEQYKLEIDGLRKSLDDENLLTKELKAEICCLRLNQDQINHVHSVRLQEELNTAREISKTSEETLKRKFEDFQRETALKEMESKAKIESLETELKDKNLMLEKYSQKIEHLTNDNFRVTQSFNVSFFTKVFGIRDNRRFRVVRNPRWRSGFWTVSPGLTSLSFDNTFQNY